MRHRGMDDADLIRRFLAGRDDDAFAEIVQRHRHRVFRVVASILGEDGAAFADDVVQDTFIRCAAVLDSFRFESSFSTWLYRLAFNVAIDARRSMQARIRREQGFAEWSRKSRSSSPDESVRDAVRALPDVYRFVINAYYWFGSTTSEIAELLGVADGTVKSYLFRARAILSRELKRSE
ncbi:MAG: RNA polymerase sigma factor [Thermoanaerobaculia bacterium]